YRPARRTGHAAVRECEADVAAADEPVDAGAAVEADARGAARRGEGGAGDGQLVVAGAAPEDKAAQPRGDQPRPRGQAVVGPGAGRAAGIVAGRSRAIALDDQLVARRAGLAAGGEGDAELREGVAGRGVHRQRVVVVRAVEDEVVEVGRLTAVGQRAVDEDLE